jgi:hypothetical protein
VAFDAHKNFAYTTVASAPSPADSGTTLDVVDPSVFPAVPFNATIWPLAQLPVGSTAEVVRVTGIAGNTLTITRTQEGSSARTILSGDQIAETITAKALTDIEAAVDVVSNALSVEVSARTAADNLLSQAISVVSAVAASALSVALVASVAIAAETSNRISADNAISNAVSIVSQAVSAEVSNRVSADNALSVRIDTVSNLVSGVSQRLSLLSNTNSADHASLSLRITSVAGLGGTGSVTSTELSAVSAQAASAISQLTSLHNVLSNLVSDSLSAGDVISAMLAGLSARTTGAVSVKGLQSIVNALSGRISAIVGGTGSVTSTEVSAGDAAVSAQAASALSQIKSVLSQAISAELSNRQSADNAVSAQAASALSQALSVLSVADAALSNKISAVSAAVTSVDTLHSILSAKVVSISAQVVSIDTLHSILSAKVVSISAQIVSVDGRVNSVNTFVSGISARSVGNVSTHGFQSIIDALSGRISAIVGGSGSVTSTEVSAGDAATSAQAASALSQALSVLSVADAGLSLRITSVAGLAGGGSVTSTEASAISAQAASAISVVRADLATLSLAVSALSTNVSTLSAKVVSISAQIVSVDAHADAASAAATSALNALSALCVVVSNALSAGDVASNAISAISQRLSVKAPWPAAVFAVTSGTQSTTASALTDVSGMVLTVAAGESWRIQGMMLVSTSAAGAGFRAGFSVPPLSTPRYAQFIYTSGLAQSAIGVHAGGQLQVSGNSIILSLTSTTPAGTPAVVKFEAFMNVASGGTVRLMAAGIASTAQSPLQIMGANWICHRLK